MDVEDVEDEEDIMLELDGSIEDVNIVDISFVSEELDGKCIVINIVMVEEFDDVEFEVLEFVEVED